MYRYFECYRGGESKGDRIRMADVLYPWLPAEKTRRVEGGGGEAGVIVSPPHRKTVLATSFIFGIWESFWFESTWGLSAQLLIKFRLFFQREMEKHFCAKLGDQNY